MRRVVDSRQTSGHIYGILILLFIMDAVMEVNILRTISVQAADLSK